MTRTFILLSALAVVLIPLALLTVLRLTTDGELSGIKVDTSPIVAPSTTRTIDDRTSVEVRLAWGDNAALLEQSCSAAPPTPGKATNGASS